MTFRRATIDDARPVLALVEGAYRGESARKGWSHEADLLDGQRTDIDALRAIVSDPAKALLILEEEGVLRGCVAVENKGAGRTYLGMLTVRPDLQAAGLGRELLWEAERFAVATFRARVMEMTVIEQRAPLIAWYERRGYRNTGRMEPFPMEDRRFGVPKVRALRFVVLEKELSREDA